MIVIERYWQESNHLGGNINKAERKCFNDNDIEGVEKFINEKSPIPGHEWTNVKYNYIKL